MRHPVIELSLLAVLVTACSSETGPFTDDEWDRLTSLADLPAVPRDPTNKYDGNPDAISLGKKFYFDPGFSGKATTKDTLGRDIPIARAARGVDVNISCATCHEVTRGGADHTSNPDHVAIGTGAGDTNGMQTINAAYFKLFYWNGRVDSLWAQVIGMTENPVMMGSSRLKNFWRIKDAYAAEFDAAFAPDTLPVTPTLAEQKARIDTVATSPTFGQCKVTGPGCATGDGECVEETDTAGVHTCWPRWPLQGRPGATTGCQRGNPKEPFGDAFDCMAMADRGAVTATYVRFAKAIAAYEATLVSRDSAFDRFVAAGPTSTAMPPAAVRGAQLFVSKAACIDCHSTPLFSDNYDHPDNPLPGFHNTGIPQFGTYVPAVPDCPDGGTCDCVVSEDPTFGPAKNCLPWGITDGLTKLKTNPVRRDSMFSDDPTDTSRSAFYYADAVPDDLRGMWKTSSLRDIALSPPYMHTGAYATLTDVVWHYNRGGSGAQNVSGTIDPRIKPLGLTESEVADLVAFLTALTGAPLPPEVTSPPTLPAPTTF